MDLEKKQRNKRADKKGGGCGVDGKLYAREGEKGKKPGLALMSEASVLK